MLDFMWNILIIKNIKTKNVNIYIEKKTNKTDKCLKQTNQHKPITKNITKKNRYII